MNIPKIVCDVCGYADCDRKLFLDSRPEWVGSNGERYDEARRKCQRQAEDLGERYAELWKLALKVVEGVYQCEDDVVERADMLDRFLRARQETP